MASFTYPGIDKAIRATYTHGHGLYPGVIDVECVAQLQPPDRFGAAVFEGGGGSVTIPDCTLDAASLRYSTSGHVVGARLLDKRWRWRFGAIYVGANRRLPDGTIFNYVSPRAIASVAFAAMGEGTADVTALPEYDAPRVLWQHRRALPALSWLLTRYGYDVIWDWATNQATIVQPGVGTPFPFTDDVQYESVAYDPPELPSQVWSVGGADQYQTRLKLEAVGLDVDGEWKPIANLSYTPSGGWSSVGSPDLLQPTGGERERELATKTVFRAYRISTMADGSLTLPYGVLDLPPITDIRQLLPLMPTLLDTNTDGDPLPPKIVGEHVPRADVPQSDESLRNTSEPGEDVREPFVMSPELGIAIFNRPVFRWSSGFAAADLYLDCAFEVRDLASELPWVPFRTRSTGGIAPIDSEFRPESQRRFAAYFTDPSAPQNVSSFDDNTVAWEFSAQAHLDAMVLKYPTVDGQVYRYRGIRDFRLDGARKQITWTVDTRNGAFTTASYSTEGANLALTARERIRAAQAEESIDEARETVWLRYGG